VTKKSKKSSKFKLNMLSTKHKTYDPTSRHDKQQGRRRLKGVYWDGVSRLPNDDYREGWDRIFGSNKGKEEKESGTIHKKNDS